MLIRSSLYSLIALLASLSAPVFAQPLTCSDVQSRLDGVSASGVQMSYDTSWNELERRFGTPSRATQDANGGNTLHYDFSGCSVEFRIGSEGKVTSKTFRFGALNVEPTTASAVGSSGQPDLASSVLVLQATIQQLDARIARLEKLLQASATPLTNPQGVPVPLLPASPAPTGLQTSAAPQAAASPAVKPTCAENGSCYGDISTTTGRPKTVYVSGYYRKDGTYVRSHYRSAPSR